MSSTDTGLNLAVSIFIASIVLLGWIIIDLTAGSLGDRKAGLNETLATDYPEETTTSTSTTTTSTTTSTHLTTSTSTTSTTTSTYDTAYVECFQNTDCGDNGTWVSREYTCYQGDIYRQYISYRCSRPGTQYASCVGKENLDLLKKCGVNEGCIDGEPFCEYVGDVDTTKAHWTPKNATILDLDSGSERTYGGYSFALLYVVSENSQPKGVMVHVQKPDGNETWEYLKAEKGTQIDDLSAGIAEMSKTESWIWAKVWIEEKKR